MEVRIVERWAERSRSKRSVIFCYHGLGATALRLDPGMLRLHPDVFRSQVQLLLDAGFEFVTVSDLVERSDGHAPPPGLVALTFDDGMDDNHSHVLPILREFGVTATFYITTGLIGQPNPWLAPESRARMMTVDELQDLVAAEFEIGAHTVTHPYLSELGYEQCLFEVNESRLVLERLLGVPVRTFAYPFCAYSPQATAAVKDAGFLAAVTCGSGIGSWDRFELPRSIVSRLDGTISFMLKLSGHHHPLFSSRPGRLVRAATRPYRYRRRGRNESGRYSEGL